MFIGQNKDDSSFEILDNAIEIIFMITAKRMSINYARGLCSNYMQQFYAIVLWHSSVPRFCNIVIFHSAVP